jgi:hypothetical protein
MAYKTHKCPTADQCDMAGHHPDVPGKHPHMGDPNDTVPDMEFGNEQFGAGEDGYSQHEGSGKSHLGHNEKHM